MKKLLFTLVLVMALAFTCISASASAEEANLYRINTEKDGLCMRHTPGGANIVIEGRNFSIPKDTEVRALEESGSYIKVCYNGVTGWVWKGLLQWLNAPTPIGKAYVRDVGMSVYFRSEPVVRDNTRIGSFSAGTEVQVLEYIGNWTKVMVNGQIGYISSDLLTDMKPSSSSTSTSASVSGVRYVTADRLNIRKGPSTSTSSIGIVSYSTKLQFIKNYSSDWAVVLYNGNAAYASRKHLSSSAPSVASYDEENAGSIRSQVNASRLNVRSDPSLDGSVIGAYDKGTRVTYDPFSKTVDAEGRVWVRLIAPSKGWAAAEYID